MKQATRILLIGVAAAGLLTATASMAGDRYSGGHSGKSYGGGKSYDDCGCSGGGHQKPSKPGTPNINVNVPQVNTTIFNVSVPVPNVHVPMFNGERTKKHKQTPEVIEKETKIIKERVIQRENTRTVFLGGGGGSSMVIVQAPPVPMGRINIETPKPVVPKPVKGECQGPKGHLEAAWRVSPAEIHPGYEGEVFRCDAGFSLVSTVGKMVDGYRDYRDGFIIECLEGEALRFGQGGMLACAPQEQRYSKAYSHRVAGGPDAEVLIFRDGAEQGHGHSEVSLEGMYLTGGVGGTVY